MMFETKDHAPLQRRAFTLRSDTPVGAHSCAAAASPLPLWRLRSPCWKAAIRTWPPPAVCRLFDAELDRLHRVPRIAPLLPSLKRSVLRREQMSQGMSRTPRDYPAWEAMADRFMSLRSRTKHKTNTSLRRTQYANNVRSETESIPESGSASFHADPALGIWVHGKPRTLIHALEILSARIMVSVVQSGTQCHKGNSGRTSPLELQHIRCHVQ